MGLCVKLTLSIYVNILVTCVQLRPRLQVEFLWGYLPPRTEALVMVGIWTRSQCQPCAIARQETWTPTDVSRRV